MPTTTTSSIVVENDDAEDFYSYDGYGNNINNPTWGNANTGRVRIMPNIGPQYYHNNNNGNNDDDSSTTNNNNNNIPLDSYNTPNLPSARRIMELLWRKAKPKPDKLTNHLLMEFGFLMSQDMVGLSPVNKSESFDIPCDGIKTDILFCPVTGQEYNISTSQQNMTFYRKAHVVLTQQSQSSSSQQSSSSSTTTYQKRATLNGMTSYLDLSNIYGISTERVMEGRTLQGDGKLKLTTEDGLLLLPEEEIVSYPASIVSTGIYSLYVIFVRYHNYLASKYAIDNPQATDEELYQYARRRNIAIYQSIVEQKYIPLLLETTLPMYKGYNPNINPSMDEFFVAVAYKYAHSSVSGNIRILNSKFQPTTSDLTLRTQHTFKASKPDDIPSIIRNNGEGIEAFVRGLTRMPLKAVDASIVDDLNLWSAATSVLDVQRARDVGIPSYNSVRINMGLSRVESYRELSNDDPILIEALQELYGLDNIDLVDAFVGAYIEEPRSREPLGPLLFKSIENQFTRLRDGDRFWYKNLYSVAEQAEFPTFTDIIQTVCNDMDLFPIDPFQVYDPSSDSVNVENSNNNGDTNDDDVCEASRKNSISLLGGQINVGWIIDDGVSSSTTPKEQQRMISQTELVESSPPQRTIDLTLTANEMFEGPGFIGIGFGKQVMLDSEIWWCWIEEQPFEVIMRDINGLDEECPSSSIPPKSSSKMFDCCLARGGLHTIGPCADPTIDSVYYQLEVVDWCLSDISASVTVRAPICDDSSSSSSISSSNLSMNNNESINNRRQQRNCMPISSSTDFIVAYNPFSGLRTHGYYRRTHSQVDLNAGILTQSEGGTADEGLIATHGVFMLVSWMIAAPWAIYIVRFLKTRKWRLIAHISLMGFAGSLMIPLLIGVEASVGATDKTAGHALVGLILMCVYFVMALMGRLRYLRLEGRKLGERTALASKIIHMYGGYVVLGLAWWNCYTGLIRIGPEDSQFTVVLFSSFPLGYDIHVFGVIRQYIFFPYIALVILIFAITEYRRYKRIKEHAEKISEIVTKDVSSRASSNRGAEAFRGCIFPTDADASDQETMSMETFLDATKLGKALCIVDGHVLDITDFMHVHPGGLRLLRYASGSDITEELFGRRDVDGTRHVHSPDALKLLRTLVVAKLDDSDLPGDDDIDDEEAVPTTSANGKSQRVSFPPSIRSRQSQVFFPARVLEIKYLTPGIGIAKDSKPVILLRLSIPRSSPFAAATKDGSPFPPSCIFTFRGVSSKGATVERKYTPVHLNRDILRPSITVDKKTIREKESEEEIYCFLISLIPDGQMSKVFLRLKAGKVLLVQGPNVNAGTVSTIQSKIWRSVVLLCAGTGISPMLQVIDHYLNKESFPPMFLVWVLKGPAHNYRQEVGLMKLVKRSAGKLKWVIIYSSTSRSGESDNDPAPNKSNDGVIERVDSGRLPDEAKRLTKRRSSSYIGSKKKNSSRISSITHNVKDLITIESDWQRRSSGSVALSVSSDMDDDFEFDEDFWTLANTSVARKYDEYLLKDLFRSIDAYTNVEGPSRDQSSDSVHSKANESSCGEATDATVEETEAPDESVDDNNNNIQVEEESDVPTTPSGGRNKQVSIKIDFYEDVLVAVSGSPHFEGTTLSGLQGLGFPLKQVITFHTATDQVY